MNTSESLSAEQDRKLAPASIKLNYSFKKGCGKVSKEDYPLLQKKLMEFLGCKSRQHYYNKRKLYPNIPVHVKSGIEDVFREFGINDPEDIWTITPIN